MCGSTEERPPSEDSFELEQTMMRFEQAWKGHLDGKGEQPKVEDYLPEHQKKRSEYLKELKLTNREYIQKQEEIDACRLLLSPDGSIGPYKLIRPLGRGASGEVWFGQRHGELATTDVAIKVLPHIAVSSVIREAQTWVRASGHPNVVPIIEADIYGGIPVIVSECIPAGSLADNHQVHSPREIIDLLLGILSGLEHLHARGIIHRDLKPSNILMQEGMPRLTDFGLSRPNDTVVNSGRMGGTPAYMAPEAFNGDRSVQSDLWSVGVILFQLLCGRLPYPQTRFTEVR